MVDSAAFPPEPTHEPIRDRAATADDCAKGLAAFAADVPSPELANVPLDVFLPRVANLIMEDGTNSVVVLIQAEVSELPEKLVVLGYEDASGGLGVCTSDEVAPWPCFFVFYNNAEIDLDTLAGTYAQKFTLHGATLATRQFSESDPVLFIRHESGPHVAKMAKKVSAGTEYEDAMVNCHSCFIVCFEDLEHALDELNTLIDAQDALQKLTHGFLYLDWNGNLSASG